MEIKSVFFHFEPNLAKVVVSEFGALRDERCDLVCAHCNLALQLES